MDTNSGSRWVEVDEILSAALDLPPCERTRWLDDVCATSPELRSEVSRLLVLAEQDDERLPLGPKQRILDIVHEFLGESEIRQWQDALGVRRGTSPNRDPPRK
ncbi:MAG TPA: hypothetical protein VLK65_26630 [Vicinamibacteria bacterium]|nr:hypothetical protein [Vicinamibacteria bacterium]